MLRRTDRQIDLSGVVKEFWWVFLVLTFTFSGFIYAASSQKKVAEEIRLKIKRLEQEQKMAFEENAYLQQKLLSKDDPHYIRMTLVRVLGLTPKGQQKIIFDRLD